jgi:hypothetical protein
MFSENGAQLEKGGYTVQGDGKYYKFYPATTMTRSEQLVDLCLQDSAVPAPDYPLSRHVTWLATIPSNRNDFTVMGMYEISKNTARITVDGNWNLKFSRVKV